VVIASTVLEVLNCMWAAEVAVLYKACRVCEGLTQRDDSPVFSGVDAKYFLSNPLRYGKDIAVFGVPGFAYLSLW